MSLKKKYKNKLLTSSPLILILYKSIMSTSTHDLEYSYKEIQLLGYENKDKDMIINRVWFASKIKISGVCLFDENNSLYIILFKTDESKFRKPNNDRIFEFLKKKENTIGIIQPNNLDIDFYKYLNKNDNIIIRKYQHFTSYIYNNYDEITTFFSNSLYYNILNHPFILTKNLLVIDSKKCIVAYTIKPKKKCKMDNLVNGAPIYDLFYKVVGFVHIGYYNKITDTLMIALLFKTKIVSPKSIKKIKKGILFQNILNMK